MTQRSKKRSLPVRILMYAVAATLAFALAAGVGAMAALMVQGELDLPGREGPRPPDEQENAAQSQQDDAASQLNGAEYASKVGDIQAKSVDTFLDSHDKLVRYDALTAEDVQEMQRNQAALKDFTDQVNGLDPPEEYSAHYEVFRSAINELNEATKLAYILAVDPTAATKSGFDKYDRHVDEAAARLQQSNEILGRDYKTLKGAHVEEISPL
jgi:hypothetical protein